MIALTTLALITSIALFSLAVILWAVWDWKPKKQDYQKPRTYERETESEYQNSLNE